MLGHVCTLLVHMFVLSGISLLTGHVRRPLPLDDMGRTLFHFLYALGGLGQRISRYTGRNRKWSFFDIAGCVWCVRVTAKSAWRWD